jgi:hypothetical protein
MEKLEANRNSNTDEATEAYANSRNPAAVLDEAPLNIDEDGVIVED